MGLLHTSDPLASLSKLLVRRTVTVSLVLDLVLAFSACSAAQKQPHPPSGNSVVETMAPNSPAVIGTTTINYNNLIPKLHPDLTSQALQHSIELIEEMHVDQIVFFLDGGSMDDAARWEERDSGFQAVEKAIDALPYHFTTLKRYAHYMQECDELGRSALFEEVPPVVVLQGQNQEANGLLKAADSIIGTARSGNSRPQCFAIARKLQPIITAEVDALAQVVGTNVKQQLLGEARRISLQGYKSALQRKDFSQDQRIEAARRMVIQSVAVRKENDHLDVVVASLKSFAAYNQKALESYPDHRKTKNNLIGLVNSSDQF